MGKPKAKNDRQTTIRIHADKGRKINRRSNTRGIIKN